MCLIFVALKTHPDYKLVIAANRDEFYKRKTAAAEFWPDQRNILGGRDLEAGGTWLALSTSGRIGMVTNYRDPNNINPAAPSRGQLVSDYLLGDSDAEIYTKQINEAGKRYNGYNLLLGTADELWYSSNYTDKISLLKNGVYGLSNHLLETPWPKVKRGKEKFLDIIGSSSIDPESFFKVLYDEQVAADELLPDTGVGLERERALSSMFIKSPGYGTRCSTVVLVDHENKVTFSERVYDATTFLHSTKEFTFQIEKILQH